MPDIYNTEEMKAFLILNGDFSKAIDLQVQSYSDIAAKYTKAFPTCLKVFITIIILLSLSLY